MAVRDKPVNQGRHEAGCKVCGHPEREQIEADWCAWANTSELAKQYGLSRNSLHRHTLALNLRERRAKNLKAALERIIEQADVVTVNAGAVVAAVQAYAKINSAGQWVDRTERINLNDLFARMTAEELESYARSGQLPAWFENVTGGTPIDSQEDKADAKVEQNQQETD